MTYTVPTRERYDVVVVGSGPCGAGAALQAAALGYSVIVVEGCRDRVARDWFFIADTPLSPACLGTHFEDARDQAFAAAGVELIFVDSIVQSFGSTETQSGAPTPFGEDRPAPLSYRDYRFQSLHGAVVADRMIYCPDGVRISDAYVPRVVWSPWDIAPVHGNRGVAVVGSGIRAADSALFVATWTEVTLYDATPVPEPWRAAVLDHPRIRRVPPGARVQYRVEPDAVVILQGPAAHVFEGIVLADDYLPDWNVLDCPEFVNVLQRRARSGEIPIAGVMSGIPCTDHSALYADGQAAARRLQQRHRGWRPAH